MNIFVLSAIDLEILPLVRAFSLDGPHPYGFTDMWKGKDFTLVRTNMGKVNAGAVTQLVIDRDRPDWIVNVGVTGGFAKEVACGDIVMPTGVVQYDYDLTKFGHPLGSVHVIGEVVMPLASVGKNQIWKRGVCLTADRILSDKEEGTVLYDMFHPAVVDMELGSIAQVCRLNNIRLVSLKSPVDIVEKEEFTSFTERTDVAMERLSSSLKHLITLLSSGA